MKKLKISKVWIAMTVVVIIAVAAWALSGGKEKEEINFKQEKVSLQTLQNSVTATGTIEAVTSVTVGTQVSGIVNKLYVDYNSQVKKGQVIAELDKTNLLSELNTAKANMASAQSQLNYQSANMKRYQTLYQKGLVSADDYENALLTYRQAKEEVATAKEQVQRAQTNLGYATITSPIDGTVISKSVEEGQTVAASFNTPELFTIAKDLTNMQVVADVDEADIGGVKEGDRVTFRRRLSRRHLRGYGEAGSSAGHDNQQRGNLRGGDQRTECRSETETGTHRQCHYLHAGTYWRTGCSQQGAALHTYQGNRRQRHEDS